MIVLFMSRQQICLWQDINRLQEAVLAMSWS